MGVAEAAGPKMPEYGGPAVTVLGGEHFAVKGARKQVRRRSPGAGRRAGAPVLALSLVATVPGTTATGPLALVGDVLSQVALTGDFQDAPLQVPQPGGLTGPDWSPEPPSVRLAELGALSLHPSKSAARLPFALASALIADGPHQDALATRLLNAAPAGARGLAPAPAAVAALRYALAQIGRPYLWGGNGPQAYDCSGLTQQSYLHAGVLIPRTAAEQATVGRPVRLADLLPGDLLFYAHDVHNAKTIHHVAMYAGDGMLVHAPQTGDFVHLSPVWLDEYIGAVRLVPAVGRNGAAPAGPMPVSIGPVVGPPATPTPSPTSTRTSSPSPAPGGTPTTSTPPPTTSTPPPTTASPDPTPTDSPTPSDTTTAPPPDPTPTDSPTPTPSDSPTASPTATDSPTASDTPTATPQASDPAPSPSGTPAASPSGP
jgi:cell wall-associated NlpC family hydrolase